MCCVMVHLAYVALYFLREGRRRASAVGAVEEAGP